jgi:hypothetical protein
MLYFLSALLVLQATAKNCPIIECRQSISDGICAEGSVGTLSIAPCKPWETCPNPTDTDNIQTLTCRIVLSDVYGFNTESYEEYVENRISRMDYNFERSVDITSRTVWESCYETWEFCDKSFGIVCHCDGYCMCVPGRGDGEACSNYIDGVEPECKHGFGCLNGVCVDWFS